MTSTKGNPTEGKSIIMTQDEMDNVKSIILSFDCEEMAQALKRIHDIALYCSDVPIEESEKAALYQVNMLSEGLRNLY